MKIALSQHEDSIIFFPNIIKAYSLVIVEKNGIICQKLFASFWLNFSFYDGLSRGKFAQLISDLKERPRRSFQQARSPEIRTGFLFLFFKLSEIEAFRCQGINKTLLLVKWLKKPIVTYCSLPKILRKPIFKLAVFESLACTKALC